MFLDKSELERQIIVNTKVEKNIKLARQERPEEIQFEASEVPSEETPSQKQSRQKEDREQYEFLKKMEKETIKVIDDFAKAKGKFIINLNDELQRKDYIVAGDIVGKMYDDIWDDFNSTKDHRSTIINEKLHLLRLTPQMNMQQFFEEMLDLLRCYEDLGGQIYSDPQKKQLCQRNLEASERIPQCLSNKLVTISTVGGINGQITFEQYCSSLKELDATTAWKTERYTYT